MWFEVLHVLEVMKAWTFHGSFHPFFNDILEKTKGAGWILEIADDGTHIF